MTAHYSPVRSTRNNAIECLLCPKHCLIEPGQSGECRIRVNIDGRLVAVTYGHPVSVHVDPMEKKPLYHFLPGSSTFSLATVGCNMHCLNCQNWQISQANPEDWQSYDLPPERLVGLARAERCRSISYTYTEPLVYFEYTLESSRLARQAGLQNVLVTAGFANRAPLEQLYALTDAANIDLKAMSDDFYVRICGGQLAPVLASLQLAREMGVWIEVTNLVIPSLNDDLDMLRRLAAWVAENLGEDTPIHFSAFTPRHQLADLPRTPVRTLEQARQIAHSEGVRYVYLGNLGRSSDSNTYCHSCGTILIERVGYTIRSNRIEGTGVCPACVTTIPGVWQ